jgi:hypothetical protein
MTPERQHALAAGGALALGAGLLVAQGSVLGPDLQHVALLGAALGAVLGLVPDGSVVGRTGGFLVGFGSAWLGYALRAGVFPDTTSGVALAAVLVLAVVTLVAFATAGRLPLWSCLLGAGALLGAYETTFVATPTSFLADSTSAATTVLVASAFGLLITSVVTDLLSARSSGAEADETAPPRRHRLAVPTPRSAADAAAQKEASR